MHTYHFALRCMMAKKDVNPKSNRCVLLPQEFDFEVKYRSGVRIKWPIISIDWRMNLCVNWEKRLKLMLYFQIGCLSESDPMVCRHCELYGKLFGSIRFEIPPKKKFHAWYEKVLL